ncbi:hypothetical protein, partial [Pseudomonas sp. RW405]|uniref:hypothetical protein n=1 Tax=Pseudomonas sp. RW405 TaxID=2202652 RepID=UPI001C4988EE
MSFAGQTGRCFNRLKSNSFYWGATSGLQGAGGVLTGAGLITATQTQNKKAPDLTIKAPFR